MARALSKLGFCSRGQAWELIRAGRVRINDAICRDGERRVMLEMDRIAVDGERIAKAQKVYAMLNKPRGLVTTTVDERGRKTVYTCLADATELPKMFPVGRLDQASEGLLLFTNDTAWAARITAPQSHVAKTYHVQIDRVADSALLKQLEQGVDLDGEFLTAKRIRVLRAGGKNCWLEIVLDEGRNRHIRRMLAAFDIAVLRLVRVAIGGLALGDLPKGKWRALTRGEVRQLASPENNF